MQCPSAAFIFFSFIVSFICVERLSSAIVNCVGFCLITVRQFVFLLVATQVVFLSK